jgi:hypothetical protein
VNHPKRRFFWLCVLGWLLVVLLTCSRHEFYRDEVRALSLAMDARSLSDLPRLLQDEGHPILWYVLLWSGYHITSSTLVLPVLSVLIAGAAVVVFVAFSPFPRWLQAMFVFGGLPLYEYSVSARNYGISMLIMFVFAWLYPSRRKHPILLGLLLALLCNTNIHSLLLGGVLLAMWGWDVFSGERGRGSRHVIRFGAAASVAAAGMAAAFLIVRPTNEMAASDTSGYRLPNVARAVVHAATTPAGAFPDIAPGPPGVLAPIGSVLLVASTLGLIGQPAAFVAALGGLVALSVLFQLVYPGGYRHQGLFVVFVMTLYWIVLASEETRLRSKRLDVIARAGLYGALPVLLGILVVTGVAYAYGDLAHEESGSKALGRFLQSHHEYDRAILIGEPDFAMESVHYYVSNPIYIVREQRFGNTVRFVRSARADMTLLDLLRASWDVRIREQRDVLIALGHLKELDPASTVNTEVTSVSYKYGKTFSWSADEIRIWNACTEPLRRFGDDAITDERYTLYRLVAAPPR